VIGIWQWASAQTVRPVIWANQDGPQPTPPYVTIQAIATMREGQPCIGDVGDDGIAMIRQGSVITVRVQTFGEGALGLVQTLRNSLERITVQRALRVASLSYVDVPSEPADLPMVTGTTWQGRAAMDVRFRTAVAIPDDIGVIEGVAFTGEFDGAEASGEAGTIPPPPEPEPEPEPEPDPEQDGGEP
jgi:hypothetical protein